MQTDAKGNIIGPSKTSDDETLENAAVGMGIAAGIGYLVITGLVITILIIVIVKLSKKK